MDTPGRCQARTEDKHVRHEGTLHRAVDVWDRAAALPVSLRGRESGIGGTDGFSHLDGGSGNGTNISAMESVPNLYSLPKETGICFDSLCLYQADDNAAFGLSIAQQLVKKPFALIIGRKPTHGMFVIHTIISEVYDRLWRVHEMDEFFVAGINIYTVCLILQAGTTRSLKKLPKVSRHVVQIVKAKTRQC